MGSIISVVNKKQNCGVKPQTYKTIFDLNSAKKADKIASAALLTLSGAAVYGLPCSEPKALLLGQKDSTKSAEKCQEMKYAVKYFPKNQGCRGEAFNRVDKTAKII